MEEIELYRGPNKRLCHELALVLQSRGIPSRQVQDTGGYVLLVLAQHAGIASNELVAYQSENAGRGKAVAQELSPRAGRLEACGYAIVMAVFYAADKYRFFGLDWLAQGRTDSRLGFAGNLERAVTSLTLHADLRHILSNIFFGALFSVLLSQAVGAGAAWLGIILSGFLGNLLSVWVSSPEGAVAHTSIGASTMVFGTLGMLAAYQWRVRNRANLGLKQWAPLIAGTVLLGFFGFGGGARTNYMAHLTGFVSGAVLGALLGGTRPLQLSARWQRILLSTAFGLTVVAWAWAFAN